MTALTLKLQSIGRAIICQAPGALVGFFIGCAFTGFWIGVGAG